MKVSKLENYLLQIYKTGAINHMRPAVLLLGPPGIGKSMTCWSLAKRIAESMGKQFIDYNDDEAQKILAEPERYFVFNDFRLTEVEPSDLIGVPRETDGSTRFSPLLWARCLSKTAGLLLLDELTNVQRPDVITAAYKILFDRKAGYVRFHDDVFIVACGNRPEHSAVASMLPTPLISRMIVIDIDPPTVDEWADWMNKTYDDWDKRCYAFLRRFEDEQYLIRVPKSTETLDAYPVPRTWTYLATLMAKGVSDPYTVKGLVGYEVGTKFLAFLDVNVDIDELIARPELFDELGFDAKYMVAVLLGNWINQHANFAKAFKLVDKMSFERKEFLVLACMSMQKKRLVDFLRQLFNHNPEYKDALSEIALGIKESIAT
ncbi:MAG: hypothetical protein ACP5KV_04180 [Candidatus Methanomethylicaceae archaeon]